MVPTSAILTVIVASAVLDTSFSDCNGLGCCISHSFSQFDGEVLHLTKPQRW